MAFGDLLRQHRLASGVSQEQLAELAHMSASAIGALERGARRAPYRETVTHLANALNLAGADRIELEEAAQRARGRQSPTESDQPVPHNLPARLTSFVGRDDEIAEIGALLGAHRLVTITGSGGIGKTRIAIEIAWQILRQKREEVSFADLSVVTDRSFLVEAIASALDVALAELGQPLPSLIGRLHARKLLLVLDNCEHIVDEAATAARAILNGCPDIVILATSRERLAIEGEVAYRLPSLPVPLGTPSSITDAYSYAALRLFMDRANSITPGLELSPELVGTLAAICRQLEGIPLAIELAASRLQTLGFNVLNRRLTDRLPIVGSSRALPHRQKTMLSTIAWSYDLLSENEKLLLRRLTVFRGRISFDAVGAVCADDMLASADIPELLSALVEKSLLIVSTVGERTQYFLLESVRSFASQKLNDDSGHTLLARSHASWLATVADQAHETFLKVPRKKWLIEYGVELDNARAALEWALRAGTSEDALLAARIVGGLRGLWILSGKNVECLRWSEEVLARVDDSRHPQIVVRVMRAYLQSSRGPAFFAAAERAIPLFERVDRPGLASLLGSSVYFERSMTGDYAGAADALERAINIATDEGMQHTLPYLDLLQNRVGAFLAQGSRHVEPLLNFAVAELVLGNISAAKAAACEVLELTRFENLDGVLAIQALAAVAAVCGQARPAARLAGFIDGWWQQQGYVRNLYDAASHDILTTSLRELLNAHALVALMAEGRRLDPERVVDEALSL
jgi:predicted ATPase/DNA-binding XRE family transcriptional regulator